MKSLLGVLVLATLSGCVTTPESGLVIQVKKDKVVEQLDENLSSIASHNIEMREMAEVERLTEKTKFKILEAAAKQGGNLSVAGALLHLDTYKKNLRKIVDAINIERKLLGRAHQDYQVYQRLSAEIASYLAKIGRITPDQLRAFGDGLTGDTDKIISNVAAARAEEIKAREALVRLREREKALEEKEEE